MGDVLRHRPKVGILECKRVLGVPASCYLGTYATAVVCRMSLPSYCSATDGGLGPLLSRNLKCGAAVHPRLRFLRHPLCVQWELPGSCAESSVCTPMLVLVRLQRHYIAGDCDAFGSFVLTSDDRLVIVVSSKVTETTN